MFSADFQKLIEEDRLEIDQEKILIDLARQLIHLRKKRNLSQSDLAKKLNVDRSRISKMESVNPRRNLTVDSIAEYVNALDGIVHLVVFAEEDRPGPAEVKTFKESHTVADYFNREFAFSQNESDERRSTDADYTWHHKARELERKVSQ